MDYFSVNMTDTQLLALSCLALAHIGDAVYELMVRTHLAALGRETNRGLHRETVRYVSAPAQAAAAKKIAPMLTSEEAEVFRRGRNAKVHAAPKASTLSEYHTATALEALFGYLYLSGRRDRLNELFAAILEEDHA